MGRSPAGGVRNSEWELRTPPAGLLPTYSASMRILTYNIAGNRGRGRPAHLARVAELVLEADADVVGLQDVVDHGGMEQPEKVLARLTGMHAYFQAAHVGKRHI